jgi:hypothetical protein
MTQKRAIDFDILRSVCVFNALMLHFHNNFNFKLLAIPSIIFQDYLFSVGGVFFFSAGYMARKIYFSKYSAYPNKLSKTIVFKGINLIFLYVLFVFFMRIFTDTNMPKNAFSFLFHHEYFTKVIFTFGLLYLITPLYLLLFDKHRRLLFFIIAAMGIAVILYNQNWLMSSPFKVVFFDRKLFLYPLFPSIIVYTVGFLISHFEDIKRLEITSSIKSFLFMIIVFCTHLLLCLISPTYHDLVANRQYFTFVEAIFIYIAIIGIRYLINIDLFYKYLSNPHILCIGVLSLEFYLIFNLFLGLVSLSKGSEPIIKLFGLLGIFALSYLFTFWRFIGIYEIDPLTHRFNRRQKN